MSGLKEKVKDLKPGKSRQRIKELKSSIVTLEQVTSDLHNQIYKLEHEKKQMLQSKGTVSQSDSKETENLATSIKELEAKLSRKGTGKPRNNKTPDEDVLKLRNEGKSIRAILA